MSDNLKEKTIASIKWLAVDRIGQQSLQLIISITLARSLAVESFGLIAMLAVFNALSMVFVDSGFGQSLIRKRTNNNREYSSIFYFNFIVGLLLYGVLYITSPFIAHYYSTPELTVVARFVFLIIPINSLYIIPSVKLGMMLNYKTISKINIASTAISGTIAIVLALQSYEVWAIVWQMISYHLFRFVFYYLTVQWKPLFYFSFAYIREHWWFSVNLLGTSVLNALFNNIFTFIFGKFYSSSVVGYYYQANKQAETVNYAINTIFTGSTYNIFSQIQEDTTRLRNMLKVFISKIALIAFPVGFFLIFSAEDLIITLVTEKWLASVPYFQIIVAANMLAPLYLLNLNALNARGKSKLTFRIELLKKLMIIIVIVALVNFGGIAMIMGYAVVSWLSYLISTWFSKKELKYYWRNQIKDILPAISVGIVIALTCWLISLLYLPFLVSLITKSVASLVIYYLIIRLFFKELYLQLKSNLF